MIQFFLNPWMLAGLAGVLLPVLAHLLSRKRYDTVQWGAMQFLELDPSARRNLHLEDLLLLLIRMSLIALLAIALARPWFNGAWLGRWATAASRDVVIVVDGSYSMGWEGRAGTSKDAAIRLARQFVNELHAGDSVMVLDAREQPRLALPGPTRDRERIRQALENLPVPSGTANLHEAISKGLQILAAGTNVQRDLIILTDYQALSWKPDDEALWSRIDDLMAQSTVPPRIWAIDASSGELGKASNFTVERLKLSRELAVPGVPVRFSTTIRYRGGDTPIARNVYVEVDGQRLADQTLRMNLTPGGEGTVEFERQFDKPGSHLVSVLLDNDALPADNRSDAAVVVADSLPVVLVDGDRKLDPTRCETFFARAALAAAGSEVSWIKPSIVAPNELNADVLRKAAVVVIANVESLSPETLVLLEKSVSSGRGLLFTLGDRVPKEGYTIDPDAPSAALFPVKLIELATEPNKESQGVHVAGKSLELPWLREFRADKGGTLTDARFSKWWKVAPSQARQPPKTEDGQEARKTGKSTADVGSPLVIAKLTTGDPWLITRRYGRGMTAVLTSTLDADWNTLPAKIDFVPWLHELLISIASTTTNRNVEVGVPLVLNVAPDLKVETYEFVEPGNKRVAAEKIYDELQPGAMLSEVSLPGVYRFSKKSSEGKPQPTDDFFVVNFDRGESDLTPLTEDQRQILTQQHRLTFSADLLELETRVFADSARTEVWWLLIYGFLALMAMEVWMIRRMLRGAAEVTP